MPTPGLKVTEALVSTRSGGVPFSASACESAMLKQEAWAAAMSSSGVVVVSLPSLRDFQSIGNVPRCEEEKATVPEPSVSDPVQVAAASLVTGMVPPVLTPPGERRRLLVSLPSDRAFGNRRQAARRGRPVSPTRCSRR